MAISSEFWGLLAPHHAAIEDHFFDRAGLRAILDAIAQPVLVVGAGQGLIVGELRNRGIQCDGIDHSSEMIHHAKLRRGLTLIPADARAMPFPDGTYATIIYATGVIDFLADDEDIRAILSEGKRVVRTPGKVFVAFYRLSRAQENFLHKVGLLSNNVLLHRQSLELYLLNPAQMVAWVARRAGTGYLHAMAILLGLTARSTLQEKVRTFSMQKIFRNPEVAKALINAASEDQPYRNEKEIRNLFKRLAIPVIPVKAPPSCWIVQI